MDITEYRLFSGKCSQCDETTRARKPSDIPQGIMGPNLLSHIAILAGQYHLSVRKIRSLLKEQFDTTFSIGAIKSLVIGRKNWLFSTNPLGADASALLYSIIGRRKLTD